MFWNFIKVSHMKTDKEIKKKTGMNTAVSDPAAWKREKCSLGFIVTEQQSILNS